MFNDIIENKLFKPFMHKEMENNTNDAIKSRDHKEPEKDFAQDLTKPES